MRTQNHKCAHKYEADGASRLTVDGCTHMPWTHTTKRLIPSRPDEGNNHMFSIKSVIFKLEREEEELNRLNKIAQKSIDSNHNLKPKDFNAEEHL